MEKVDHVGLRTNDAQNLVKPPSGNHPNKFFENLKFDRFELAGSFGDLGTLLPIVQGMILINKLSPSSVFLSFGVFYGIRDRRSVCFDGLGLRQRNFSRFLYQESQNETGVA